MSGTVFPTPGFTHTDVRYAADPAIIQRAEQLWRSGKVRDVQFDGRYYQATVQGSRPYRVSVGEKRLDEGMCECYMGQRGEFCKHALAVALAALEKAGVDPADSLPQSETEAKQHISAGVRKITAYTGNSYRWFAYQGKLDLGCGMIQESLSMLPANKTNAAYLWRLVLRLSKKLSHGGVDDSDGTVGACIDAIVEQLVRWAETDAKLHAHIQKICVEETGFGFEETLQQQLRKQSST